MSVQADDGDRLISMREVCAITSWSRSSINRLIGRGEISAPLKLGRHKIAFRESEIRAYVASRQRRVVAAPPDASAEAAQGAGAST
jgi:predicted DNA-binding transcriptional regulator AlpA